MSVTNDPNYHEGQPVFQNAAKGEAYQPTSDHLDRNNPPQGSETGARCPWCGSDMQARMRENARHSVTGAIVVENPWLFECSNEDCPSIIWYPTWAAALAAAARRLEPDEGAGNDAGSSVEGLGLQPRMLGSPEATDAGARSAPRPLPDFPAGKSEDEGWISNAISKIPKRYILCPTCGEKNRIIVCVNLCGLPTAPARPAAAGVEQLRKAAENMLAAIGWVDVPLSRHESFWKAQRELAEALSLLSSRATGAEVEIPTWTDDDFCKSLCEHMGSLSLEGYDPIHRRGMRYGFAAGIKWAREQYAHRQVEIVIEEPSGDWISNQWSASIKEAAVDPNGGNDVYRFYRRVLDYARRHATIRGKP